jgi:hypothetical protein
LFLAKFNNLQIFFSHGNYGCVIVQIPAPLILINDNKGWFLKPV